MNFDKLFEPIQIGTMELKNRIAINVCGGAAFY